MNLFRYGFAIVAGLYFILAERDIIKMEIFMAFSRLSSDRIFNILIIKDLYK